MKRLIIFGVYISISLIAYFVFNFPFLFLFFPPMILNKDRNKVINKPNNNFCINCGGNLDVNWVYCPFCSEKKDNEIYSEYV